MQDPRLERVKELAQILDDSLSREEFFDLFKKVLDFVRALEPKMLGKVDLKVANEQKKLLADFKKELGKISEEAKNQDKKAFKKLESAVNSLTNYLVSESNRKMKQVDEKLSMIRDGKDADEDMIVSRVLKMVPTPQFDESRLQSIKNELIDEVRKNKRVQTPARSKIEMLGDVKLTNLADNEILQYDSATRTWQNSPAGSGSGDVVGPSSSVDNSIARFDGTTGKLLQGYTSGAPTISDTGDLILGTGKIYKTGTINMLFAVGTASYYVGGAGNTGSSATSSLGMGSSALAAVETNGFNVAIGNQAMELTTSGGANTAVGYKALNANLTGTGNVCIGANAGRYATGDNEFYVNSINRGNTATDKTASLLYGVMFATASVASQTLVTNAAFTATYGMNVPTGQTYKINGVALAYTDITGAISASSTDTLTNKTLTTPKFADLGFIADSSGNEMLQFDEVASAANYIRIINSTAGSGPTIIADGSDTDITLKLYAKGNGTVEVNAGFNVGSNRLYMTGGGLGIVDSGSNEYLKFVQVASAVNEFTITNAATGNSPVLSTTGSNTDITMTLDAKGVGNINMGSSMTGDVVAKVDLDMEDEVIHFDQQNISYNSGTTTVDWNSGPKASLTFGAGNITTLAFTNPPGCCNVTLKVIQDATGSRTITGYDTDIKWVNGVVPTLSTAANAIDILSCYFDGTNYFCSLQKGFA